jgi:hypothetical protein
VNTPEGLAWDLAFARNQLQRFSAERAAPPDDSPVRRRILDIVCEFYQGEVARLEPLCQQLGIVVELPIA